MYWFVAMKVWYWSSMILKCLVLVWCRNGFNGFVMILVWYGNGFNGFVMILVWYGNGFDG